ncbi:zinc finger CCHC domain-containing protein 9-like [Zerene cesonia]|uniref:zinc finger CCHC domain-containing protein 9-like n=1 Tax=Zerene cesonia TaxID=33412 RepID=UPI0018E54DA0|nr:zinc finger CCHC domain-containing protein 9-like [Zerene cesonia]
MTRFARAKGSKASNLKDPEDSTPWEVMKEQLVKAKKESEESKKREEAEQQRINNYENFLKDRRVEKRKAEWCDFPETKKTQNESQSSPEKKKKLKNNNKVDGSHTGNPVVTTDILKKKNKKKNKQKNKSECNNTDNIENAAVHDSSQTLMNGTESQKTPNNNDPSQANDKFNKKPHNSNIPQSEQVDNKKKKKNKKNLISENNTQEGKSKQAQSQYNPQQQNMQAKKKKKIGDGPVRRKEINDRSFKLIINGKDIELVRFDGFPIMKRDADRLQELKNSMIKKGIPKSEVQRTMKLERRRAEKALARLKRDVCYNCRKGGHNLSDCPDLKSNIPGVDSADGVCFKCGSTEHRQNECKVQRDKEFRFATCFICREPGHLARQCPDNPKGLYPNGGSCKLCGDVTHLRKDCPTVTEKKESTSIKLSTLETSDNIEDIGQSSKPIVSAEPSKKPKKIKF